MESEDHTKAPSVTKAVSVPSRVKLHVGGATFLTTKEELQGQDEGSFFHFQFSGRWTTHVDDQAYTNLDVKDRCGRLFRHVLYYLQFGDIPRHGSTRLSLLDPETLQLLQVEAEFFQLPKLVLLCQDPSPPPTFVLSEYSMGSSKNSEQVVIRHYDTYKSAKEQFDVMAKHLHGDDGKVYVKGEDEPPNGHTVQYVWMVKSVDAKTGYELYDVHETGYCKRSWGVSLHVWNHNKIKEWNATAVPAGQLSRHKVRSYPDETTY